MEVKKIKIRDSKESKRKDEKMPKRGKHLEGKKKR